MLPKAWLQYLYIIPCEGVGVGVNVLVGLTVGVNVFVGVIVGVGVVVFVGVYDGFGFGSVFKQ